MKGCQKMRFEFSNSSLRNAIILILMIFILAIYYNLFTAPRNFEDCVLYNSKNGGSNFHAQIAYKMCKRKFPNE